MVQNDGSKPVCVCIKQVAPWAVLTCHSCAQWLWVAKSDFPQEVEGVDAAVKEAAEYRTCTNGKCSLGCGYSEHPQSPESRIVCRRFRLVQMGGL